VDETRTEQKGSKHPKETPLVAEYPFFRRILVNPGQKKPPKVSTLYSKNPKDWQVLIIKSDVWGDVKIGNDSDSPRYWVDKLADISDEIKTLRDTFPHIEVIPKWPDGFVTWEEVAKRLMEKQWDVVHFAGHGFYLYNAGERLGGIVLSESRNSNKPVGILTGTIEEVITQCPGIVLAYLSSCEGAMTDGKIRNQVFYSSFNGVVGSLLRGCGSVIAYRWPVSDKGACKLALNFYQRLAPKPGQGERQTIESALQQARWHVHSNEESENIWASAVLAFCPYSKGEK
jgi:CHAT domain-containing protein